MKEKRKYNRKNCDFKVRVVELNNKPVNTDYSRAIGVNISPGGLCFAFVSVFDERDRLKLMIERIKGEKIPPIVANVKIVWSKCYYSFVSTFGCKFTKISPKKRDYLETLVQA